MRRALLIGLLAASLGAEAPPCAAQSPPPNATTGVDTRGSEKEDLEAQPPIQAYYHRAFFGEPWRTPAASEVAMVRQTTAVLGAAVVLGLFLRWRRRRYALEASRA